MTDTAAVRRAFGFDEMSAQELQQPLIFFRVEWDFRWLSRREVVRGLAGEEQVGEEVVGEEQGHGGESIAKSIVEQSALERPAELDECLMALRTVLGRTSGISLDQNLQFADTSSELQQLKASENLPTENVASDGKRSVVGDRPVVVLPGGWNRVDSWVALRWSVAKDAAIVVPPEEGAWAWTLLWAGPTVVIAAADQLAMLAEQVSAFRGLKKRRAKKRLAAARHFLVPHQHQDSSGAEDLTHRVIESYRRLGVDIETPWSANDVRVGEA